MACGLSTLQTGQFCSLTSPSVRLIAFIFLTSELVANFLWAQSLNVWRSWRSFDFNFFSICILYARKPRPFRKIFHNVDCHNLQLLHTMANSFESSSIRCSIVFGAHCTPSMRMLLIHYSKCVAKPVHGSVLNYNLHKLIHTLKVFTILNYIWG